MAKIKPAEEVELRSGKHGGQSIQNSRSGWTLKNNPITRTWRNKEQDYPKKFLLSAARHWKMLTEEQQTVWDNWAALYPQPSKLNPAVFLSGYELFIKRNYYCLLNIPDKTDWMLSPGPGDLVLEEVELTIDHRTNVIDVTEPYLANFGFLPEPGQWLILRVLPYSNKSGQFFDVIEKTLEVLEIYMDGLFVSLSLPANCPEVTFSVFLSSPFTSGQQYAGTKYRYMGCFTATTFLALTDTPDSYDGQAGKTVKVKDDESGLEFIEPSSGGLTCDDLPDCPTIVTINTQINNVITEIIPVINESVPKLNRGLLYNRYAILDSRKISSSDDWDCPTAAQWEALITFFGSQAAAGAAMKVTSLSFWNSPNTGAADTANFNGRSTGYINGSLLVPFTEIGQYCRFWTKDNASKNYQLDYNTSDFKGVTTFGKWVYGYPARLCRLNPTAANFSIGCYFGNDGKAYRTVTIAGIEYLGDNLAETKFRNGEEIPYGNNKTMWPITLSALLTPYNFDWSNM